MWAAAAATAAAVAVVAEGEASWPAAPKVECRWDSAGVSLELRWHPTASPFPTPVPADLYEIQFAPHPAARAAAVYTTAAVNASVGLELLLPETTYFASARAHAGWAWARGGLMGVQTWGMLGPITKCATGHAAGRPSSGPGPGPGPARTMTFESFRISEFSTEVDYLLNHDAADLHGSALLLTGLGQYEALTGVLALHDSWVGASTPEMVVTRFCVDAIRPPTPGTVTTRGATDWADYVSCNNQADKTTATCSCAVPADRQWGRLPLSPACHAGATKLPCSKNPGPQCRCSCDPVAAKTSATYVGMVPTFALDDADSAPVGKWYSHPVGGACRGEEPLGHVRPDGSVCAWRARPAARVIRGWELYAAGFNTSDLNCDPADGVGASCSPRAAQIRENGRVVRGVFDAAPLQPWACV